MSELTANEYMDRAREMLRRDEHERHKVATMQIMLARLVDLTCHSGDPLIRACCDVLTDKDGAFAEVMKLVKAMSEVAPACAAGSERGESR